MPDLLAGRRVDGGRAVVGREMVPAGEAVDVLDLGHDPAGDDRADAVEIGQVRSVGRDELTDLTAHRLDLRVEGLNVRDVLVRELNPHQVDWGVRTQQTQCVHGFAGGELAGHAARSELDEQSVQATDRLRAKRDQLGSAVGQQSQAHQVVVAAHRGNAGAEQCRGADRDGVVKIGLAAMSLGVDANSCREFGRHVKHGLAAGNKSLSQRTAGAMTALDGPTSIGPLASERAELLVSAGRV
ncbi:MAG: hypothetical protein M3071_13485 [Actinomycetota bacterium]|nr:hypothetical protein [Actinomycetota bacterium]